MKTAEHKRAASWYSDEAKWRAARQAKAEGTMPLDCESSHSEAAKWSKAAETLPLDINVASSCSNAFLRNSFVTRDRSLNSGRLFDPVKFSMRNLALRK